MVYAASAIMLTGNSTPARTAPPEPLLYDEARRRDNSLTLMRLCLAVCVVFGHSFALRDRDNHAEWLMRLSRGQTSAGELAVNAFFVLSGFLIVQSAQTSLSTKDYLQKRVRRIYPGFLAASLFCAVVVGPLASASLPEYIHGLRRIGLHQMFGTLTLDYLYWPFTFTSLPVPGAVNLAMWTIRYEFWCYLGVAALGAAGLLRRPRACLALFGLLFLANAAQEVYVLRHHLTIDTFTGYAHGREIKLLGRLDYWPRFASFFAAGAVFYLYRALIPRSWRLLWLCLGLLALACQTGAGLNILLPVCGAYALLYAGLCRSQPGAWIAARGDFSYGLYLYAFPVQQLLLLHIGSRISPYSLFILALVATAPLAAASWFLVEQPFLKRKLHFAAGPAPAR